MIDAWIQHPTARHSGDPMFDSLRRWTKSDLDAVPTVAERSTRVRESRASAGTACGALSSPWRM